MPSAERCPLVELDHCISRERIEREAASRASDPAVRAVHLIMAERYAARAGSLSERCNLEFRQQRISV